MLDPAKELAIRTALGNRIFSVTAFVFIRRPYIDSRQDWASYAYANTDGELEMKVCTVDLLRFDDSTEYGCDDDPQVTLTYGVHLFMQYNEGRTDGSNSTDDFISKLLYLRYTHLTGDRAVAGVTGAEYLPLVQANSILLGDDPLTGAYGHSVDLIAKVVID